MRLTENKKAFPGYGKAFCFYIKEMRLQGGIRCGPGHSSNPTASYIVPVTRG